MVLYGKVELKRVNLFMPTVETSLISPHHHASNNYSLTETQIQAKSLPNKLWVPLDQA